MIDPPWQETFETLDAMDAVCAKYDDGGGEAEALRVASFRRLQWRRRHSGKECSRCMETKPVKDFGPDGRKSDGLQGICRACDARRK